MTKERDPLQEEEVKIRIASGMLKNLMLARGDYEKLRNILVRLSIDCDTIKSTIRLELKRADYINAVNELDLQKEKLDYILGIIEAYMKTEENIIKNKEKEDFMKKRERVDLLITALQVFQKACENAKKALGSARAKAA
jgi:hypothetical protein